MMLATPAREFITKQEFAVIFGVTLKTVSNMMKDGRIGYVKLGKITRIHRSEIERLATQSRRENVA